MIALAFSLRSLTGFRLMSMRPLLSVMFAAVDADERGQADDVRVLEDHRGHRRLAARHLGEGHRLRRLGDGLDDAGVLHREESLGNEDVEERR